MASEYSSDDLVLGFKPVHSSIKIHNTNSDYIITLAKQGVHCILESFTVQYHNEIQKK